MKRRKKMTALILFVSLMVATSYSPGWAWEKWGKNDPVTDEWNMVDLLVARPVGILAGIAGAGIFLLTLPFTIPTGSVHDAADRFVVSPFKFSFVREYPDENM